jgi:hypothetical protein
MFTNILVFLKKNASAVFLIFTISFVLLFNISESHWQKNKVIDWDITSYYGYLPAYFIHNDLTLSFTKESSYYVKERQFWPETAPNGGKVIKTTMGMAILYSPFFAVGHLEAKLFDQKQDGFSYPYHKWIHFAGLFYFIVGVFFLRKVLLNYFSELATGTTLFIIICCTNALYYSSILTAMPHMIDFCLLSIFMFLCIKWLASPSFKKTILLGLVSGLMILIRPTNILFFLFPIFLSVINFGQFKERISLFLKEWKKLTLIGVLIFAIILPQLIYWKFITGHFVFNSYVGENFFWSNPHILEGLFSYRKGWLVYSPIMILSIFGFVVLFMKKKELFWSVFPFFLINIYVLFCWWSWWYGGGFGLRAMIDCYPIMAIPVGGFIHEVIKRRNKIILLIVAVCTILTFKLNLIQIEQYKSAIVHWDGMTKEAYWASFAGKDYDSTYWNLIKPPDYDKARKGIDEYDFKPF